MPVIAKRYRTPHTSERAFVNKNLCRMLVLVAARAYETLGEQLVRQNGMPYNHEDREALARTLRRYAAQRRGEPAATAPGFNRDQAVYAYGKAFPSGHAIPCNLTPAQMRAYLEAGWFISVSGNTDDVPHRSTLDDYVNDVAHEIGIEPWPDNGFWVVEPMRPRGSGLTRVSFSDIKRFSSEFADAQGRRFCIRVKAGYDTKAARVARDRTEQHVAALARVRAVHREVVNDYEEQLRECQDDAMDGAAEALLDALHEWEEAQRTAL